MTTRDIRKAIVPPGRGWEIAVRSLIAAIFAVGSVLAVTFIH